MFLECLIIVYHYFNKILFMIIKIAEREIHALYLALKLKCRVFIQGTI